MTNKNAIKMKIFRRCLKIFSVSGIRKKQSIVVGLAIILLFASAAYYALKTNLTYRSSHKTKHQPDANRQFLSRSFHSDEAFKQSDAEQAQKHMHVYTDMGIPIKIDPGNLYVPREKIVHLDLKGAPPTIEYLKRFFPIIKNLGATGILIEYEDMFPYSGSLGDITAHNHYTRKDVLEIISMAESTGLGVIPLVQTFGHLEFALKRPSLIHLRENPDSPQALCPSLNASLVFIENMISQVMELHYRRTAHLHIGCDEVFHLAECGRCSARRDDGGRSKDIIFLSHVVNVAKMIRRRWPEVRPLIWDDMLRHIPDDLLSLFDIGEYVDPVVWWYSDDIYRFIPPTTWDKYSKVFRTAWAASAYKGAFGETLIAPDAQRHLANNLQWLRVMAEQRRRFSQGLAGLVLTGWQRYDHFAVLCELLPAALPSLALALLTVDGRVREAPRALAGALGCADLSALRLEADPAMWNAFEDCIFPGSTFFKAAYKFNFVETEAAKFIDQLSRQNGWLTEYNVRHKFLSVERALGAVTADGQLDAEKLLRELVHVAEYARAALRNVTDSHAADEWIEQKPYPLILKLEKILADVESLKSLKTWDRRPLKAPADLSRFG